MTRELIEETDIPAEIQEMAQEHAKLIEAVAETDEALIEKYLEGEELTEAEIAKVCARDNCRYDCASAVWLCLQKQRRPVDVGCGCRLLTCTN